jgi:hypothetical protein
LLQLIKTGFAILILGSSFNTPSPVALYDPPEILGIEVTTEELPQAPAPTPAIESIPDLIKNEALASSLTVSEAQHLQDIALCESGFQQFKNGALYRGEVHSADVGVFQINEAVHVRSPGEYDFYGTKGNIKFAIRLYKAQGSTPWNPSRECWSRSPAGWR